MRRSCAGGRRRSVEEKIAGFVGFCSVDDAAGATLAVTSGVLLGAHKQKDAGLRAFADVEREAGAEFVRQRRD